MVSHDSTNSILSDWRNSSWRDSTLIITWYLHPRKTYYADNYLTERSQFCTFFILVKKKNKLLKSSLNQAVSACSCCKHLFSYISSLPRPITFSFVSRLYNIMTDQLIPFPLLIRELLICFSLFLYLVLIQSILFLFFLIAFILLPSIQILLWFHGIGSDIWPTLIQTLDIYFSHLCFCPSCFLQQCAPLFLNLSHASHFHLYSLICIRLRRFSPLKTVNGSAAFLSHFFRAPVKLIK